MWDHCNAAERETGKTPRNIKLFVFAAKKVKIFEKVYVGNMFESPYCSPGQNI